MLYNGDFTSWHGFTIARCIIYYIDDRTLYKISSLTLEQTCTYIIMFSFKLQTFQMYNMHYKIFHISVYFFWILCIVCFYLSASLPGSIAALPLPDIRSPYVGEFLISFPDKAISNSNLNSNSNFVITNLK